MTVGSIRPDPFDEATLQFYAAEAPVYVASGRNGAARPLDGFLERLRPGARILELGCGGGVDAREMIARGFDVDPTDGVPEIAAKAEARLGRPVRVMRFDELAAVQAYDAVWAHASLLHVPLAVLPDVLARIHRSLKADGLHFASYKSGGAEGRDRFGRYFNYPSDERLRECYTRSGAWSAIGIEAYQGGGYDGLQGPWLALTARR